LWDLISAKKKRRKREKSPRTKAGHIPQATGVLHPAGIKEKNRRLISKPPQSSALFHHLKERTPNRLSLGDHLLWEWQQEARRTKSPSPLRSKNQGGCGKTPQRSTVKIRNPQVVSRFRAKISTPCRNNPPLRPPLY